MSSFAINSSFVASDVSWLDDEKKESESQRDAHELAEVCVEEGLDEGALFLLQRWQRRNAYPAAVNTLISSPHYLAVWAGGVALNTGSTGIEDAIAKECATTTFSTGVAFLALIDGVTASAGIQRLVWGRDTFTASLEKLANALTDRHMDPWKLEQLKAECGLKIRDALGQPELKEVITQIQADAVQSLQGAATTIAKLVNAVEIRVMGKLAADLLGANPAGVEAVGIHSLDDLNAFLAKTPQLQLDEATRAELHDVFSKQEANFAAQQSLTDAGLGLGLVTNVASLIRAPLELWRFFETRASLKTVKAKLEQAVQTLQGKPGKEILVNLLEAFRNKIKSNTAALFGGFTRGANAVSGIVIKSIGLATGVATGAVTGGITAVVLIIYAGKAFAQAHYNRVARQWEMVVSNSFKIAQHASAEDAARAINPTISQDIEALVADLDSIRELVNAMGRPELLEAFESDFTKADGHREKQLSLLHSLIEACLSATDEEFCRHLINSSDVREQIEGHCLKDKVEARKKAAGAKTVAWGNTEKPSDETTSGRAKASASSPTQETAPKTTQAPAARPPGNTLEEKLLRNTIEKAIAEVSGTIPGGFFYNFFSKANKEEIKATARSFLEMRYGKSENVKKLISLIEDLHANKELVRNNPIKFLWNSKPWKLSAKAKDIEAALENKKDVTALSARTLVAVMTDNNASTIASCRFKEETDEHAHLTRHIKKVRETATRPHLKAFVRAMETSNGKKLMAVVQKMRKGGLDDQIKATLETALMLSGSSPEQAVLIRQAILNFESEASNEDIGNALAIALGQKLHAEIQHGTLRGHILGLINLDHPGAAELSGASSSMIFVKTTERPERWDLYAQDVIAGKCRLSDAPDWLMNKNVRKKLSDRSRHFGPNCLEALQEQLSIGLNRWHQPLSLLWPRTVVTWRSEQDWRADFRALTGGVAPRNATVAEMKKAARMLAAWRRGAKPSLEYLEKMVRQHTPAAMAHPRNQGEGPLLFLRVALTWALSNRLKTIDDMRTFQQLAKARIQQLAQTRNSTEFIDTLVQFAKAHEKNPASVSDHLEDQSTHDDEANTSDIDHNDSKYTEPLPKERRRSMVIPSHTLALLKRDEEERDAAVEIRFKPVVVQEKKRRNSENLPSTMNRSSMVKEIHRRRNLDERMAGEPSQDRLPVEGVPSMDNAATPTRNDIPWMRAYANAAHAQKAHLDKLWKAKVPAVSDQPLSALSAD